MFTAFISAFCAGCVMLGALYILVPEGRLSKAATYAFSLAFLCLILSVAVGLGKIEWPQINTDEKDFNNERLSAASAQMVFSEALSKENINFSKITVFTDKNEDGSIIITKVFVYTAADSQKVTSLIGSDSYEVVVINE